MKRSRILILGTFCTMSLCYSCQNNTGNTQTSKNGAINEPAYITAQRIEAKLKAQFPDLNGNYSQGYMPVKVNGKYGYVDSTGKALTPAIYDQANTYKDGFAAVSRDGGWTALNLEGKEQFEPKKEWGEIISLNGGLMMIFSTEDNSSGIADHSGKVLVPMIYKSLSPTYGSYGNFICSLNDKFGVIKSNGEMLIAPNYEKLTGGRSNRSGKDEPFAAMKDGKWGLLSSKDGSILHPFTMDYEYVDDYSNGMAVITQNGVAGMINIKGEETITPTYTKLGPWNEWAHATVTDNDKLGMIGTNYKKILMGDHVGMQQIGPNHFMVRDVVKDVDEVTVQDSTGKNLWGKSYEDIIEVGDGLFLVKETNEPKLEYYVNLTGLKVYEIFR